MTLSAELPLITAAVGLILVSLLRARRDRPWRLALALGIGVITALAPVIFAPLVSPERNTGRALWEWSAIGGPTIQASYRLDGIGAVGASAAALYVVAAIISATRLRGRPPLLAALLISIGHTAIALAVTDDFIASIVLLSVLAAFTVAAAVLVTPPPAAARAAAYLAIGIQCFVLAALLISRFGGGSFQFAEIRPTAISPGIILAASLGGALFAGLYPFVPWRYLRPPGPVAEREAFRGLLAMPVGLGASVVLLRLLGVTRMDLVTLGVPGIDGAARTLIAIAIVLAVLVVAVRRRVIPGRSIVGGGALLTITLTYPGLHWSYLALAAALFTILYAAAASLAFPDEWEVARHDVTLATLWIAFAIGTPIAIAVGLGLVVAGALLTIADSVWLAPHRAHIVLVTGATLHVAGVGGLALQATDLADPLATVLALAALLAILGLQLAQLERRLQIASPPPALDGTAAAAAFLTAMLVAMVVAPSLASGVAGSLGRPLPATIAQAPTAVPLVIAVAIVLIAAARALRPMLPTLEPLGRRLGDLVSLADPVPAAGAAFIALEWTAVRAAGMFAFIERRAGVGLATLLIAALLIWSVR